MLFDQTFALSDIPRVFTLAFLELLLSSDNAIVLGLITFALPQSLRRKALFIGLASAFILRAIALLSVAYLLKYAWIQLLGAAYLLYLSVRHFTKKKNQPSLPTTSHSFWKTVLLIELFDLAFAIDSIVAGVAFINEIPSTSTFHPKLWIVYLGGMLGLMGIRYAAELFSSLLEKFPRLETSAYLIIGWIGIELSATAFHFSFPYMAMVFWSVIILLFLFGLTGAVKKKSKPL